MSCGRDCDWGQGCGFLPFGRASIASGYTPATVPGRCPEPRPLKGRKERSMQREKKTEIITLRVTPQVKGAHPGQGAGAGPDRHRLPVSLWAGQEDRPGGRSGSGAVRTESPGAKPEPAHHPGQHGEDHRSVRRQAGGGLRPDQRTAPAAPAGGDLRWLPSPPSRTGAEAGALWAACCGTSSRTKRRCGRGSGW